MNFLKTDDFIEQLSPGRMGREFVPVKHIVENFNPLINRYMLKLIVSKKFHRTVEEYHQARYLRHQLDSWQNGLPAMKMILDEKRKTHDQKLARIVSDDSLKKVADLERQRDNYYRKIARIEDEDNALSLMTNHEKELMGLIESIEKKSNVLGGVDEEFALLMHKKRLVTGLLKWRLESEFPERLWLVKKEFRMLDKAIEKMARSVESLKTTWNSAPDDFSSFDERIRHKAEKIEVLKYQAENSMAYYENKLRNMFVSNLKDYRNQLKLFHDRALYAKARLYDSLMARE
jgi:hypothetical protein